MGKKGSCVFFFFSSRRRHTRCGRDWSSDVCSSDLGPVAARRLKSALLDTGAQDTLFPMELADALGIHLGGERDAIRWRGQRYWVEFCQWALQNQPPMGASKPASLVTCPEPLGVAFHPRFAARDFDPSGDHSLLFLGAR